MVQFGCNQLALHSRWCTFIWCFGDSGWFSWYCPCPVLSDDYLAVSSVPLPKSSRCTALYRNHWSIWNVISHLHFISGFLSYADVCWLWVTCFSVRPVRMICYVSGELRLLTLNARSKRTILSMTFHLCSSSDFWSLSDATCHMCQFVRSRQ